MTQPYTCDHLTTSEVRKVVGDVWRHFLDGLMLGYTEDMLQDLAEEYQFWITQYTRRLGLDDKAY